MTKADVTAPEAVATAEMSGPLPTGGFDHAGLENEGPKAFGDRMGTPQPDERVLWKGRPRLGLLARTAFHGRSAGAYMAVLVVIALATGRNDAAIVAALLGVALVAILHILAWASARSTLYILTDQRLIMRLGIAIETRVNIPLKQITAAHLAVLTKDGHGDIAFELAGERLLTTLLLWPHVRPFRYARPEPMLRSVPDAAALAQTIAEARARFGAIERNLSEIKEATPASVHTAGQATAVPPRLAPVIHRGEPGLEGAPRMIVREYEEDEITVHKVPLMLMGGIVAISLVLTASVTLGFVPKQSVPAEARAAAGIGVGQARTIRFFDEPDGSVRIEDGATGEFLARHGVGAGGFIRATVRSLVHQRRIRGLGPEVAFTLTEWQNGNLTLADPATGRSVEVSSFGPDNRAVYEDLLPAKGANR